MDFNRNFLPEIVLVDTQLPENLGATARCMLNFQFEKLRVINPKFSLDNEKILPICAGADRVIKKVKIYENFSDSIKDFNLSVPFEFTGISKIKFDHSMLNHFRFIPLVLSPTI